MVRIPAEHSFPAMRIKSNPSQKWADFHVDA
jgi:hypothetical protein